MRKFLLVIAALFFSVPAFGMGTKPKTTTVTVTRVVHDTTFVNCGDKKVAVRRRRVVRPQRGVGAVQHAPASVATGRLGFHPG